MHCVHRRRYELTPSVSSDRSADMTNELAVKPRPHRQLFAATGLMTEFDWTGSTRSALILLLLLSAKMTQLKGIIWIRNFIIHRKLKIKIGLTSTEQQLLPRKWLRTQCHYGFTRTFLLNVQWQKLWHLGNAKPESFKSEDEMTV